MRLLSRHRTLRLLLLSFALSSPLAAAPALRFFALGDLPYTPAEREMLETLLSDVRRPPPFLVHIGDIKRGNEPCTDRALARMAELFKAQPVPVVYTPGDNDWTDCRRPKAGGYDPTERLGTLRRLYFGDPAVLRLQALGITRENADYPENYRFIREGVFFATVHVVGSRNNLFRDDPAAVAEVTARSAANRRHLRAAIKAANAAHASAFVLLFHADPRFEKAQPPRFFAPLYADLRELLRGFSGPILAIHGDTHIYRLDHPLRDPETGKTLTRFTRLEVPGSPTVAGVWVSVDPQAAEPFSVERVLARRH